MSRIKVSNLPKYITQERLRDIFSQKGEITDVQIKKKSDGKSRGFAFIGYRTEKEAQEALEYFNGSFIDASKVICKVALKIGDPCIPRPWSRNSAKSGCKSATGSADADLVSSSVLNRKEKKRRKINENEDPKLQEFLKVMQPWAKTKLWEDDVADTIPSDKEKQSDTKGTAKNRRVKKKQVSYNNDETMTNEVHDDQPESKATETIKMTVHDDAVSDVDYLKSRIKDWSDSEIDDNAEASDVSMEERRVGKKDSVRKKSNYQLQTNDNVDETLWKDVDDEVSGSEKPKPTNNHEVDIEFEKDRLYVVNLPYTATEDELEEFFSKIGSVSQAHIVRYKHTKKPKGFGFIRYSTPEYAARALKELANSIFQGRCLNVLPAERKSSHDKEAGTNPNHVKNFKEKREEARKASEANGNTKAWNTFFMRQDTVVEYNAIKYGASKSDILDPEANDIAVRVALGEAQVIADTKKALQSAGINVAALEELVSGKTKVKRSNHVIIVKNLPYGSTEGELAKMFGKFGSLDKIILPLTKMMALIIYLEPSEAQKAFKCTMYSRYRDVPLYLEWAPANLLDGNWNSTAVGECAPKKQLVEDETLLVDIDPDRVASRSIYVTNLYFKTTEESLGKHFAENLKEGNISSVKIIKHMKKGKLVSKGFGFIEFDSVDTATRACKGLQETVLDGCPLKLDLCHAKEGEKTSGKTEKGKSLTKIIVKNVAFEATKNDLRQLFGTYGQIKSLRLPIKCENKKSFFAFIDFKTKQDAQNALQALSSTHLYGRRLVLERANEGESLEVLRKRTAAQYSNEQNGFQTKLSKKRKHKDS